MVEQWHVPVHCDQRQKQAQTHSKIRRDHNFVDLITITVIRAVTLIQGQNSRGPRPTLATCVRISRPIKEVMCCFAETPVTFVKTPPATPPMTSREREGGGAGSRRGNIECDVWFDDQRGGGGTGEMVGGGLSWVNSSIVNADNCENLVNTSCDLELIDSGLAVVSTRVVGHTDTTTTVQLTDHSSDPSLSLSFETFFSRSQKAKSWDVTSWLFSTTIRIIRTLKRTLRQ